MSDVSRIFVVEGDEGLNRNLVNTLRKDGYQVQGVTNGTDAVRALWSEEYDVVILGLHHGRQPKFVRRYASLADNATDALQQFCADVQSGTFPSDAESYHLDEETARALRLFKAQE